MVIGCRLGAGAWGGGGHHEFVDATLYIDYMSGNAVLIISIWIFTKKKQFSKIFIDTIRGLQNVIFQIGPETQRVGCFIFWLFLNFKLLFTYMVPLDVKITGVKFQTFSTNSRRRARPFFDTLYILYKFLYTLTVKNTKIAEKWSNMVNSNFEWFESIKALKISNFLLRLLISDQNWRFPKDIKIAKKLCFAVF